MPATVLMFPDQAGVMKHRRKASPAPQLAQGRDHVFRTESVNPDHCILVGYNSPRTNAAEGGGVLIRLELPRSVVTDATIDFMYELLRQSGVCLDAAPALQVIR